MDAYTHTRFKQVSYIFTCINTYVCIKIPAKLLSYYAFGFPLIGGEFCNCYGSCYFVLVHLSNYDGFTIFVDRY